MKLLLLAAAGVNAQTSTGDDGCPCIAVDADPAVYDWSAVQGQSACTDGLHAIVGADVECVTVANYGKGECKAWDMDLDVCQVNPKPDFCDKQWCWIDSAKQCLGGDPRESFFFGDRVTNIQIPRMPLKYSYSTCGDPGTDIFAKWAASESMDATKLQGVVEKYVARIADKIESKILELSSDETYVDCEFTDSCDGAGWLAMAWTSTDGTTIRGDLGKVAVTHPPQLADKKSSDSAKFGQCLAETVNTEFRRVVNREYTSAERTAYLYYGDQASGMYFQWPAINYCGDYDPRLRPWYVMAVTGPKDIVMIVDTSGSMANGDPPRTTAAMAAVEGLLLTFGPRDYVGLVSFASSAEVADVHVDACTDSAGETVNCLVPMTDGTPDSEGAKTADNKKLMRDYMHSQFHPLPTGGTDFMKGFQEAFLLFKDSDKADPPAKTGCNKLILFMTDGVDASSKGNAMLKEIKALQTDFGTEIPIFTYSFGDEISADPSNSLAQLPKKIACQNSGIAYQIPDGQPLVDTMVDYYKYFSNGLSATDPHLQKVRWTEYTDGWVGGRLLAGCMAVYDKNKKSAGQVDLLGVTCMDMNVILPLGIGTGESPNNPLEARDNYPTFKDAIDEESNRCMAVSHDQSSLQRMRRAHPDSSECKACDTQDEWCEPESDDAEESTAAAFLMGALLLLHA
jgi:hypothetical protein